MSDKMWAGRFAKALDKQADDFNSSIPFDSRMAQQDFGQVFALLAEMI